MSVPTATVRAMNRAMRAVDGTTTVDGYQIRFETSHRYGRRRYMLSYLKPYLREGHAVMIDPAEGTVWIKFASTSADDRLLWDAMWPAISGVLGSLWIGDDHPTTEQHIGPRVTYRWA